MVHIDINENIFIRKFLAENFANEINANYGILLTRAPLIIELFFLTKCPGDQKGE